MLARGTMTSHRRQFPCLISIQLKKVYQNRNAVLVSMSATENESNSMYTHLESLVLQDFFDGHQFIGVAQFGLVHDAEGAVADDLGVGVGHFLRPLWTLPWRRHHRRHLAAVLVCKTTTHELKWCSECLQS